MAPRLDRVIVLVMENKAYDQVRTLPYTTSLMAQGSVMSNSYAITHPSQPNYLTLWAGGTFGVSSNACPAPGSPFMVENLGHACEAAGLTWRSYAENLPAAGSPVCTADGSLYARKHCPWTNFGNLNHQNERPFTDFSVDLARGTLPDLAFVVPNNCHNSHSCPAGDADTWMAANVPAMLDALGPRGVLILTWDEDNDHAGNHILTVFVGPEVKTGYTSTTMINHYTLLRTVCELLGITPFAAAASEPSIQDIWLGPTAAKASTWGSLHVLYR